MTHHMKAELNKSRVKETARKRAEEIIAGTEEKMISGFWYAVDNCKIMIDNNDILILLIIILINSLDIRMNEQHDERKKFLRLLGLS